MKNNKNNKMLKFKPIYSANNYIYLVFIIITLVLTALTTVWLKSIMSDPSDAVPAIIIGLLSGFLASIVATWLLDIAGCSKKNKMLKKEVDKDLLPDNSFRDVIFCFITAIHNT